SFTALKDDELNSIIAYLHIHKLKGKKLDKPDPLAIKDPIPEKIDSSDVQAGIQLVAQIPKSFNEKPFARIEKLDVMPGTNRIFILDLRGKLYSLINHTAVQYLDISSYKPKFIDKPGLATGFGSFAFHPDYMKNGLFYTTHSEPPNSSKADFNYEDSINVTLQWVVCEWKAQHPGKVPFSGTCREILRVNMVSGIHGVQEIAFNPLAKKNSSDYGKLYIGVGDGGSVENGYPFIAHHINRIWGTIIRIDPSGTNSKNGKYGVPTDNPFVNNTTPGAIKEIFAYGFRNPNTMTWTKDGRMLVTNIGQANIESVNVILKGNDYGWPIREGSFALDTLSDLTKVHALPANDSIYHITYPVVQFDHDEGSAISGGKVYYGSGIPQLKGNYLFGDIVSGRLFFANVNEMYIGHKAEIKEWHIVNESGIINLRKLCGSNRVDLHFGQDHKGDVYIFTKADGKLYKLIRK
ncbi:MAG TPA: PQQ-dependent sugar dehydrogenase, partial [Flavisolibacter sp.]|nr:PQQ-dependent sugar dehydrogenase [Flavisolibacter sp.]